MVLGKNAPDQVRDLDEKLVTGGVAERVVDLLEAVEIEQEERAVRACLLAAAEPIVQRAAKQGAVGKACKWIVVSQLFQLAVTFANFTQRLVEAVDEPADLVVAGGLDPSA